MRLKHIHLPGLTSYLRAAKLQDGFVRAHLDRKAKALVKKNVKREQPVLLTFQTPPTYTCGRRDVGSLSKDQIEHLRAGGQAEFYEAMRGGQTTFHGPGQLTAYLICTLTDHKLSPKCYVNLLEECVIAAIGRYSLQTHRHKGNPGVWIHDRTLNRPASTKESHPDPSSPDPDTGSSEKKITSIGIHLRRNVSSHGIGINVCPDLDWFERITACGLPGNTITSMEVQLRRVSASQSVRRPGGMTLRKLMNRYKAGEDTGYTEDNVNGFRNLVHNGSFDSPPERSNLDTVADVFAIEVINRLRGVGDIDQLYGYDEAKAELPPF